MELITCQNAAALAAEYLQTLEPYPGTFTARGIVTCAGGRKYLTCAWVLVHMLRELGCRLPIEVWHLGKEEYDAAWAEAVRSIDVGCVDALTVLDGQEQMLPRGWALKPFAILHTTLEEVLFLDADNVPVLDPTYLFDEPAYRDCGAIFWPDGLATPADSPRWKIFGVPYRAEPEQESGQIVIDKGQCWRPLKLCAWYNRHSDFFYRYVYGDKDTFRFAWHRAGRPFAMPRRPLRKIPGTLCQHDLQGRRLFQHRSLAKWSLAGNRRTAGFEHEGRCLAHLDELRRLWQRSARARRPLPKIGNPRPIPLEAL